MKWSEFTKIARKNGWTLVRHGHSHDIYSKEGKDYNLIIERHPNEEIRPGLYKALMKQL